MPRFCYAATTPGFRTALLLRRAPPGRPLEQPRCPALRRDLGEPDDHRRRRRPAEDHRQRAVARQGIAWRLLVARARVRLVEQERGRARRGVARRGGEGGPRQLPPAAAPCGDRWTSNLL